MLFEMKNPSLNSHTLRVLAALCLLPLFCACIPIDINTDEEYDTTLLPGKWQQDDTQVFYRYNADGTGCTWDEADDITEEEAQPFTWEVDGSEMIHIHLTETGTAEVPKYYILTRLTESELRYYDAYVTSKKYTFTKVRANESRTLLERPIPRVAEANQTIKIEED